MPEVGSLFMWGSSQKRAAWRGRERAILESPLRSDIVGLSFHPLTSACKQASVEVTWKTAGTSTAARRNKDQLSGFVILVHCFSVGMEVRL